MGTEWDTKFTYSYTDDVQFGFLYGLFLPGNVFRDAGVVAGTAAAIAGDAVAQELVSTVSVKFEARFEFLSPLLRKEAGGVFLTHKTHQNAELGIRNVE